jgi:hypothetical protein
MLSVRPVLLAVALCVACGGGGQRISADMATTTPADFSSDAHPTGTVSVPTEHRPTPMTCPTRPATTGCMGGGDCKTDADCTAGANGRCNGGGIVYCTCTYDDCNSDADCAAGQDCACRITLRGTPNGTGPNHCVAANCRSDADCASGFCSPSPKADYCQSYVDGYYCHVSADECGVDRDCVVDGSGYAVCAYQPSVGHWACVLGPVCAG